MRIILMLPLIFLASCGSSLVISQKNCNAAGIWENRVEDGAEANLGRNYFYSDDRVWMFGFFKRKKEVEIESLLKNHDLSCQQLDTLSVATKNNFLDLLFSTIPFISTRSIEFSGYFKPVSIKDDGGSSRRQ